MRTRTYEPVCIPLSMKVGPVQSPEFTVNLNQLYDIRIEAQQKIPFDTLNCLLGTNPPEGIKCDRQPVIRASWIVRSKNGVPVAQGTSEDDKYGHWSTASASRDIGSFMPKKGEKYILDVNVLKDGTALLPSHPLLKVELAEGVSQDMTFFTFGLFYMCGLIVLIGVLLLIVAGIKHLVTPRLANKTQ